MKHHVIDLKVRIALYCSHFGGYMSMRRAQHYNLFHPGMSVDQRALLRKYRAAAIKQIENDNPEFKAIYEEYNK